MGSIPCLCFELPHIERSGGIYIGIGHRLLHPLEEDLLIQTGDEDRERTLLQRLLFDRTEGGEFIPAIEGSYGQCTGNYGNADHSTVIGVFGLGL